MWSVCKDWKEECAGAGEQWRGKPRETHREAQRGRGRREGRRGEGERGRKRREPAYVPVKIIRPVQLT